MENVKTYKKIQYNIINILEVIAFDNVALYEKIMSFLGQKIHFDTTDGPSRDVVPVRSQPRIFTQ